MHICIDTCMCLPVCICDINMNKEKKNQIITTNPTAKEHKETTSRFMLLGLTLLIK